MNPIIKGVDKNTKNNFDSVISPLEYEISKETSVLSTLVVRAPKDDRVKVKKELEQKLKSAKIMYVPIRQGGSTGSTELRLGGKKIRITYKPKSGGMSETTLNSTITELAPAIAFMNGKKSFNSIDDFYDFLSTAKSGGVYVNSTDEKAGLDFIEKMPDSSKFQEKMENAMAVLSYLWEEHSKSRIKRVYWGYRSKPNNINPAHKGDIFLEYETKKWLGVSLKAGGEKTAEPQLNTYVNKMYDDFNRSTEKEKLINRIYKDIHSNLKLEKDWDSRTNRKKSIEIIEQFKRNEMQKYESLYDDMLEILREAVVSLVNSSMKDTIDYIKKQVIKKDVNVPLVVVKAVGKKYHFVTDEDAIELFIPKITKIHAYKSKSSKQNWHIDLIAGKDKLTMNMSIRSNKPVPDNKLAQGFNLAVKFNGTT